MMETIEAIFPLNVEPGFNTPEEAIAFSKSIAHERHNENISSCIGRLIRFACWREDAVLLHLDNSKVLHFGCAQNVVDLTIEDDVTSNVPGGSRTQEIVLVRLAGREIYWRRGEMIRALDGNTVRRIQPSQSGFFLYVTNVGILTIDMLIDRLTGRPFLFWGLTD